MQKHTDLRAHEFAQSTDLWHLPWFAKITYALSWRHCGINPDIPTNLPDKALIVENVYKVFGFKLSWKLIGIMYMTSHLAMCH